MFKLNDSLYFTSDIFQENILNFFGTKKLSFDKIDQKIFLTIKKEFSFVKQLFLVKQIHSSRVIVPSAKLYSNTLIRVGKGDGIVTDRSNVAIAVFTGDCLPVILSDGNVIGIYHAGWKGSLENIAKVAVEAMSRFGARVSEIKVALGPSIGACCYSVDQERARMFARAYPQWKEKILTFFGEKIFLNFPLLNYLQLIEVGVKKENVDYIPFCTYCDERFFSFRRDKKLEKEMISFVVKKE